MLVQGIVMGGLFIACVKIAKDFGGAAAQKSSAWGAKLYGATVGGVGGYALRKSVGRFGASVTTGKWGESLQNAKQQGGLRGVLANSVLTVGTGASNSSFDMRKGLGASVKKINGIAGTKLDISSLGESKSKGFYDDTVAETKKRKEEREKAAKKATEIRATANETADEKKARESANIERVSTYGKVIEYKRDASGDIVTEKRMVDKKDLLGNAIMIDKRDANGNIVLDANGKPVKVAAQEERTVPVEKRDSKGNLIFMDDMFTKNITKPVSNSLAFITGERSQTNINEDVTKTATKAATAARKKRVAEARIEAQNKIFEKFGFTKDGDLKTFTELEQAIKADIEETDKEIEAIKNKGQKIKTGTKKVPKYVNGRLIPGQESEEDIFEYDLDDIQKQKIAELEQKKRVTGVARDKAKKWHDNQNDSKTWAGEDKKEDKKKEDKSKEDSK
ncbi:MAG: hypothetical protein RI996_168 [Candidatus Parcubacteria bacterium]|jgi:hypothetical protein